MTKIQLIPMLDDRMQIQDNNSVGDRMLNDYDSLNNSVIGGYNTQNVGIKGNLGMMMKIND